MSRGPVPSQLHLLSSLPSLPIGAKVRFLGCVTCYATATGSLSLVHHHPKDSQVTVAVDVNLLLETITSDNLRAGELVNVIGYITAKKAVGPCDKPRQRPMQVSVQALVLWSAGSIDIQRYERYLDVYQKS